MSEQAAQLHRVSDRIAGYVMAFFRERGVGADFQACDLCEFVWERERSVAPSSPDRIMRALREERRLDYVVTDRSKSAYRVVWAGGHVQLALEVEVGAR